MSFFSMPKGTCLLLAVLMVSPTVEAGNEGIYWAQSVEKRTEITAVLLDKARREGPQRVVVGLHTAFVPEGRLSQAGLAEQRQRITSAQSHVLARLAGLNAVERRRFKYVPFMVLEANATAIGRLAVLPMVASLQKDRLERPIMASSNEVIGSPDAWDAGYDGAGWAVAVLDTGVDKTHSFFATLSKVVSEACYSTTSLSNHSTTLCPDGGESSVVVGSGVNCSLVTQDCVHGTHVAGSVAGNDAAGPNFGVARGANIIAIQVFSSFDNAGSCGGSQNTPCVLSFVSDQVAGLERVYELGTSFDIAAANMSLGGARFGDEESCDADEGFRKAAIDNLRSVGIATVVASGNSSSRNSISTPACISSAISVGATTDADAIAGFSNVADFLDLLAPGSGITSSVPGGGLATWNGTSMATPHVAGAWAVLKQKTPVVDVDTVLAVLRNSGTRVDDDRSNGSVVDMRRINLDLALARLADTLLSDGFEGD